MYRKKLSVKACSLLQASTMISILSPHFDNFRRVTGTRQQLAVLTGKSNQLSIPVLIKLASLICVVSIHLPHYLLVVFTTRLFLRELVD